MDKLSKLLGLNLERFQSTLEYLQTFEIMKNGPHKKILRQMKFLFQ